MTHLMEVKKERLAKVQHWLAILVSANRCYVGQIIQVFLLRMFLNKDPKLPGTADNTRLVTFVGDACLTFAEIEITEIKTLNLVYENSESLSIK